MAQMTQAELAGLIARTREQSFDDAVVNVVQRLRRVIDDVEALRARDAYPAPRPAVKRAGGIAHALSWGLANCDVQLLITLGLEADVAQAAAAAEAAKTEDAARRRAAGTTGETR